MRKLNNKGMTTIEVILCFVLAAVITVSMYSSISGFNEKRQIESYREQIYTYKNVMTKMLQDDFIKVGLIGATYNSTKYKHIVNCILKDGTKRQLVIVQKLGYSDYHTGGENINDSFLISYGNPDDGLINYPIPDLGSMKVDNYGATGTHTVKDLSINNVIINIKEERVLSIYIGFYHPDFGTKYAISIVTPINYIDAGATNLSATVTPESPTPEPPAVGHYLYDVLKDESSSSLLAKEYTGSHQDSISDSGTQKIYHWYLGADSARYSSYGDYLNSISNDIKEIKSKNNVIFGNHCWQMIRTTDTGGVKLLYNGLSDNGKCLDTRTNNKFLFSNSKDEMSEYININTYYFGTGYEIDDSTGKINLTGDITKESYNNSTVSQLKGKYTCLNKNSSSGCNALYILDDYLGDGKTFRYKITNSISSSHINFTIGSIPYNYNKGLKTVGFYAGFGNEALSDGVYITPSNGITTDAVSLADGGYMHGKQYFITQEHTHESFFGKSIDWQYNMESYGNVYQLKNAHRYKHADAELINDRNHYGCIDRSTHPGHAYCNKVYYLFYLKDNNEVNRYHGIYLKDGETIDDALNNMFNSNTTNSTIKSAIDIWYKNNLNSYGSYIEDTIYCTERGISSKAGWDPNNNFFRTLEFNGKDGESLKCSSTYDSYSTSNSNAKLDYPIGLPTAQEIKLSSLPSLNSIGVDYWLGTPHSNTAQYIRNSIYNSTEQKVMGSDILDSNYIRPMISVKTGIKYYKGDGSKENPFQELAF